MYVLIVSMKVQREHVDEFLEAALGDAKGSTDTEPGCLRFDLLQDQEDPTQIYFYEVYRDRAAFEAHTQTPHMLLWRDTVKDWYEERPSARRAFSIYPSDDAWK